MKELMKKKKIIFVLGIVALAIITYFGISFSAELENDVEVTRDTLLTYYLNVTYDGIDRNGVTSSDSTISSINSGYMEVTDRIPDGLTFEGFVTTSDGTIGAVRRNDANTGCPGKVVDDTHDASNSQGTWNNGNTEYTYHGLHYDATTRTVTFKVNNLQAGCKLTVGIITRTPAVIDDPNTTTVVEKRRDFYNFGSIIEKSLSKNSNTVHVYMGSSNQTMYNVVYSYTGTVPTGAPAVPTTSSYIEGTNVGVASEPTVEGYSFSGWSTSDATVTSGLFEMPNTTVTFTGSFTEKTKYAVSYSISGTVPEGYVAPSTKNYYEDAIVDLDMLKSGDVFNGYRFLGWTSNDVTITADNNFVMPSSNVSLVGSFEPVTYTVRYAFYDGVLPPNSDTLLPATQTYHPGDAITLEGVTNPTNYRFLGWYKESNFIMPNEDVVIYGEWTRQTGTFAPTITKTRVQDKDFYHVGDEIRFEVTITNTASHAIYDVIVRENKENGFFKAPNNNEYELQSSHYIKIDSISANDSITFYAYYTVTQADAENGNTIENEVELVGALANDDRVLATGDYTATATASLQFELKICKHISGASVPNKFQIHVTKTGYDTWVVLEEDECVSLYVDPGTYTIKEVVPQEYEIYSTSGFTNATLGTVDLVGYKEVSFTNKFKKKGFYHSYGRIENTVGANS